MSGEAIFWSWVRIVRRAELGFGEGKKRVSSSTVQHVALVAITYGNADGTRIRPSTDRLARVCRVDEKTVRNCLSRLRDVGLLVRVFAGSSAGRSAKADEYRMAIPEDLADRIALLDPDERELIIPAGVEPPPVRAPRTKKTSAPASPGAAPADEPVDNPRSPGAAPADPQLPISNHRVLPPGTPGAAPQNTGCSTRPPTHRPPIDLPDANDPPYGADVEGENAGRREPSARSDHRRQVARPSTHQPPLLFPVPSLAEPDPGEYAAARAALSCLPDLGHEWIAAARAELGDGVRYAELVIRAAELSRRTA